MSTFTSTVRSALLFLLTELPVLCGAVSLHAQKDTRANFARHPYMGWSSWSRFREQPTEAIIRAQADALLANHLSELGYRYVNIDAGWSDGFDVHGIPKADLTKFPSGMDGMARYMHSHGLLFGIYLNPGVTGKLYKQNPLIVGTNSHISDITDTTQPGSTLGGTYRIDFTKPGAIKYIQSQVKQFDSWGIDFIKFDFVGPGGGNLPADNREELQQWHAAILKASHPIWLELSNFLSIDQAPLWRATSNGWRIENDIECYSCGKATNGTKGNLTEWSKVAERFVDAVRWIPYAGAGSAAGGGWNDLDTLELGNGSKDGLTAAEKKSMFTLWAITCAPLYLGSDLTQMDSADLVLLSNAALIGINQAGIPARPLDIQHLRGKSQQAWLTSYPDGSAVLTLFNLGSTSANVEVSWAEIDALRNTQLRARFTAAPPPKLHDLVSGEDIATKPGGLAIMLESHSSTALRISTTK